MNILTSSAHFRQRVIKKSYKIGVTEAAKYYKISRNAIYEWRNKYDGKPSLFEKALEACGIKYHRIRVATPRHNGKVERQHRTDEKRFYKKMKMYNLEDGRKQLAKYNEKSNNIPKICLGFLTPNEVMEKYLGVM